MLLDGLLIAARDLVNGSSIVQPEVAGDVAYIHIELDTHDTLLAEGAPSESFVDDDSRSTFHNAAEFFVLYPDAVAVPAVYCAPRVSDGFALEAIRERLAVRAGLRPAAAPMKLHGFLDAVEDTLVAGWAQNPDRPEVPVCLDVLIDDVVVAQTLANRFRGDLMAAGFGSGHHGFSMRLPAVLPRHQRAAVAVRRSSDRRVLERSFADSREA